MTIKIGLALTALTLGTLLADVASAQRYVAVNGQWLHPQEIAVLEQWNCGPIPDGAYWLNPQTGVWGYAGNPTPQGRLGEGCYAPQQQHQQQRRPSLSERGLLYSPGELLR